MKKVLIFSSFFIMITIAYMAWHSGYKKGRETGREIGFREGWAACEKDATVDWGEWR